MNRVSTNPRIDGESDLSHSIHAGKVAVVGAGGVGASFSFALLLSGLASEIVLIDANQSKAEGEALDLNHAVPHTHPTRVWAGDYGDCAGAAVTIVAAGAAQQSDQSRLELAEKNSDIFRRIVPNIVRNNPTGIILVATNPVDVLTRLTWELSGMPEEKVLGSGTILDTARFRHLLSLHFGVDPHSVHAYIVGEHGDTEVPLWSLANIAGMRFPEFCAVNNMKCDNDEMEKIFRRTRDAAYEIIRKKGATYYAIGAGLVRIVTAILRNQRTVLSVSTRITDYYGINGTFLSMPCVVGGAGVERYLRLNLSDDEATALQHSAAVVDKSMESIRQ